MKMKLIARFKSISFITICFNFAWTYARCFYEVDKYIENFEFVTDDFWLGKNKDTVSKQAYIGDYFESPKRDELKNNDEEYKLIVKEYLKELKEEKAQANILNKVDKGDLMRKSQGGNADERFMNNVCGDDKTGTRKVVEGPADIESFPWLGVLIYPKGKVRLITTVILVARNIVIGSALDVDRLPKLYFREKSKVILGQTCTRPGIKVLDYNYHPNYGNETYSSIVMIQIDLASVSQVLWPICGPPKVLKVSQFYTITLPNDCRESEIEIFSMDYVKPEVCKHYYRRTGLDLGRMWPKHGACGRARTEEECLWRNGAALVVKERGSWHLMGIGVNGPGCAAPSRYVDYAAYSGWVANSVARIGRPALTRLADNHLILRRTLDKIQRYGPCDANEVQTELFCDRTNTTSMERHIGRVKYNLTLVENYDYTCIALKANSRYTRPKISVKGICDSPHPICYSASRFVLDFYIEIAFHSEVWFKICAYGKLVAAPDPKAALKYFNRKKPPVPIPWGEYTPTEDVNTPTIPEPRMEKVTTPTVDTYMTDVEEPGLPTGKEFWILTPVIPVKKESPIEPTQEFWRLTPVMHTDNELSSPKLPEPIEEFWSLTPVISKDKESPIEPTHEFWSLTPVMHTDHELSSLKSPEPTGEMWSLTPVMSKDEESSLVTPPEHTSEFWSLTPIWSIEDESSLVISIVPIGEFWRLTPVMNEDSKTSPIVPSKPSGEFWSLTPITPKDDEAQSVKPIEPTGEYWHLTPDITEDDDSSSLTSFQPTGKFLKTTPVMSNDESFHATQVDPTEQSWRLTPVLSKDNELSSMFPFDQKDELSSLMPVLPKDEESSSVTPIKPVSESWKLTPVVRKKNKNRKNKKKSDVNPTKPASSVKPKYGKSSSATPLERKGKFWTFEPVITDSSSVTPLWKLTPDKSNDDESFYATRVESTGESWHLTPILSIDNEFSSVIPFDQKGELLSLIPVLPKDDKSSSATPIKPVSESWRLTPVVRKNNNRKNKKKTYVLPIKTASPVKPKFRKSSSATPLERKGTFWTLTPVIPKDDQAPSFKPIGPTDEYWRLTPVLSKLKPSFKDDRFMKPQIQSFDRLRQSFYLRTLVTRRQKMTAKSVHKIRPALIKRKRRPGILST